MTDHIEDLSPQDVARALTAREIVLIDVREPREFATERIAGALNFPLSTFDPAALPTGGPRRIVFQCQAGRRSMEAAELARAAGVPVDAHLAGGMSAWKDEGLAHLTVDPATGRMLERAG